MSEKSLYQKKLSRYIKHILTVKASMSSNKDKKEFNAGVSNAKIKFCDMRCEYANFPEDNDIDGSDLATFVNSL